MTMNNVVEIIVCTLCLLSINLVELQAPGWRGIIPLQSTRAEVEALIGPPVQPNGRTYDLKNERVNIVYANGGCNNRAVEWNVPPDTVISITVYPQSEVRVSDLGID